MDFRNNPNIPPDIAARLERDGGREETGPLTKLLTGVLVLGVAVVLAFLAYTRYVVHQAAVALQQANAEVQRQADALRRAQFAVEQKLSQQKEPQPAPPPGRVDQQASAQGEAARKEAAWARYYTPLPACESDGPNMDPMACANHYVQERDKFEADWASTGRAEGGPM